MNRTRFGSESLFITPFVYGVGKGLKAAATRGKNIEFSNSQLDKQFNKIFSALRARGAKPQSVFEAKMAEKGATMADTNRAMELVKTIDSEVDSMFPTIKSVLDKSSDKRKADIYKELNNILFEGSLDKAIPSSAATRTHKFLKDNNLKLENAVAEQKETIKSLQADFELQSNSLLEMTLKNQAAERELNRYSEFIRNYKLTAKILEDPIEMQRKINNGTKHIMEDIEKISATVDSLDDDMQLQSYSN